MFHCFNHAKRKNSLITEHVVATKIFLDDVCSYGNPTVNNIKFKDLKFDNPDIKVQCALVKSVKTCRLNDIPLNQYDNIPNLSAIRVNGLRVLTWKFQDEDSKQYHFLQLALEDHAFIKIRQGVKANTIEIRHNGELFKTVERKYLQLRLNDQTIDNFLLAYASLPQVQNFLNWYKQPFHLENELTLTTGPKFSIK